MELLKDKPFWIGCNKEWDTISHKSIVYCIYCTLYVAILYVIYVIITKPLCVCVIQVYVWVYVHMHV